MSTSPDAASPRMVDHDALFSTLAQIQVLEHQRQWCEMDALPAIEDELEIQERHLKRLLCPGMSSTDPLPALTRPAQAEAELTTARAMRQIKERMRGMGYTSPIEAALSLITTSARFALVTVDHHPEKWELLCREIAVVSEAAKLLPALETP